MTNIKKCSWCQGYVTLNAVTVNVQIQTGDELNGTRIFFCDDRHANLWKRSIPKKRLVSFDIIVPRINVEVRIIGRSRGFSVTEVWPDGSRYVHRTRYGVTREAFIEELKKEGYGTITWL